ncbi:MAG: GatB/YqeY domain-containing protein [Acidobacteriota bacterium]
MSLKEKISSDAITALRQKDKVTLDVLRMVKSKILELEVKLRTKKGRDYQLSDEETLEVITSYAKQRKQSIDSYTEAGRQDLADQEKNELEILNQYLPKQLSREEVEKLVDEALAETGASSMQDIGKVMKALMPKLKGAADGKTVNELVRSKLG